MLGVIDKCALPVSADEKISGILGHGSGGQFTEGYFEGVCDSDEFVRGRVANSSGDDVVKIFFVNSRGFGEPAYGEGVLRL